MIKFWQLWLKLRGSTISDTRVRINVHLKHLNWVPPKRRGNGWFPDGNSTKIAKRTLSVRPCQIGNVVDRLSQKHMFTNSWLWRQRTTWARQRPQSESLTRLIIIYLGGGLCSGDASTPFVWSFWWPVSSAMSDVRVL